MGYDKARGVVMISCGEEQACSQEVEAPLRDVLTESRVKQHILWR